MIVSIRRIELVDYIICPVCDRGHVTHDAELNSFHCDGCQYQWWPSQDYDTKKRLITNPILKNWRRQLDSYIIKCEQCGKIFDDNELEINLTNHLEEHEKLSKLQLYFKRTKVD